LRFHVLFPRKKTSIFREVTLDFQATAPVLDDLLLDVVTVIELSDHDREVADGRYKKLKTHLERPSSPLRDLLLGNSCLIYPQGSMSIGATIISGIDEDRFDVDALIDVKIPEAWPNNKPLDQLYDALQGFPDVRRIVRCTRCVQMQFAFMHFDVTILDPATEPRPERLGQIFHSPDKGPSSRVDSNPYGFSQWFRKNVTYPSTDYLQGLASRRRSFGVSRLPDLSPMLKAEQEKLPKVVPPRIDAQQVHALKLMKRFLNLRYEMRKIRRPPSIYLTKLAVTCGYDPRGLTAQVERLATKIRDDMDLACRQGKGPDERNPSHESERLNDRWPTTQNDREVLLNDMDRLLRDLAQARNSEMKDLLTILSQLFGERVKDKTYETFAKRTDQRQERRPMHFERGAGSIIPASVISAPAVVRSIQPVPQHNFHCEDRAEYK